MKTHFAQNNRSRPADFVENRRSCRSHFVCGDCGLWASAIHRDVGSGMTVVVAVAATAVTP
jgi:hypothetical protein